MLTVLTTDRERDCAGLSRRDFIRAGALSLGGLTLPAHLRTKASALASAQPEFVRDKSVVLLFLGGGAVVRQV